MRSWLFVPGDQNRKLERALGSGADALILDLEDSVAPSAKESARETVASFLKAQQAAAGPRLFVRVNALDTGLTDGDLDAVLPGRPAGIVLPKSERGADVGLLDASMTAGEAMAGLADGETRVLAIATETGASLFEMGSYRGASSRLCGLTWGAEDLSADVGAVSNRDASGGFTDLYRLARSLCLAGAAAADVPAIDTVFTDFRNGEGLAAECRAAVRDGFTGKLAIHPAQVAVINEHFTPSPAEIAEAEAVLAALEGGTGVASRNGQMIDRPHVRRAERILARAGKPLAG